MGHDGMLEMLREVISRAPKPHVQYIVLDHGLDPREVFHGTDCNRRDYVRLSPSVLDALTSIPSGQVVGVWGIPVFRRQDLSPSWPDRL